jgi:hypothetical protein
MLSRQVRVEAACGHFITWPLQCSQGFWCLTVPAHVLCLSLQEDFEMAVAKVMKKDSDRNMSLKKLWK